MPHNSPGKIRLCALGCGRSGEPEPGYSFYACPECLDLLADKFEELDRERDLQERRN